MQTTATESANVPKHHPTGSSRSHVQTINIKKYRRQLLRVRSDVSERIGDIKIVHRQIDEINIRSRRQILFFPILNNEWRSGGQRRIGDGTACRLDFGTAAPCSSRSGGTRNRSTPRARTIIFRRKKARAIVIVNESGAGIWIPKHNLVAQPQRVAHKLHLPVDEHPCCLIFLV